MRGISLLIAAGALALATAPAARGQQTVPPAEAAAVAREAEAQLRSPVTPFHTLDMCPDAAAAALRDTVLMAAQRGVPADRIVEDVIARRGEALRIVPRKSGTGLWAWLATPAVLLAGVAVVWTKLRRLRREEGPYTAPAAAPLSADEAAVLEAALRDHERAGGAA
jgi:cytochrome c-type biogenesis protein CcmH/NrfF